MHSAIKNKSIPISIAELSLRFDDIERMIVLSENDIEIVENKINDIVKQISSKIFTANPGMMNCNYCDYKKFICSYYQ